MRSSLASVVVIAALASACAAQTEIPQRARVFVQARHAGTTVELRHSCYYGDLYDENEKWLLSPRPFAETYHIVDLKGAPIHPAGQRGIVPAGTRFVVREIEFPTVGAMAKRMLTTPRYNTWVYLTPAAEEKGLPTDRKAFIVLLPMDLDTEEQAEKAFAEVLAPEGEVRTWLATLRPTVQVAIAHKDVVTGMSGQALETALGKPDHWLNDQAPNGPARVAWYPSREVWLVNGEVVEVKPARAMPEAKPATPAPAAAASKK